MTSFPAITGRQLVAALCCAEFEVARVKGSHYFVRHSDGRTTTVPVHAGETLGAGLLGKILRDVRMSRDELRALL